MFYCFLVINAVTNDSLYFKVSPKELIQTAYAIYIVFYFLAAEEKTE